MIVCSRFTIFIWLKKTYCLKSPTFCLKSGHVYYLDGVTLLISMKDNDANSSLQQSLRTMCSLIMIFNFITLESVRSVLTFNCSKFQPRFSEHN